MENNPFVSKNFVPSPLVMPNFRESNPPFNKERFKLQHDNSFGTFCFFLFRLRLFYLLVRLYIKLDQILLKPKDHLYFQSTWWSLFFSFCVCAFIAMQLVFNVFQRKNEFCHFGEIKNEIEDSIFICKLFFRLGTHHYVTFSIRPSIRLSVSPSVRLSNHPSICRAPYLRNSKAFDHDFWYTCVK